MKSWILKATGGAGALFVLTALFNACGEVGFNSMDNSSSVGAQACESNLRATFAQTLHPWLSANNRCFSCHSASHGSKDLGVSFASVMGKGDSVIFAYATNAHNSLSASTLQSEIDSFKGQWDSGLTAYTDCLSKAGNGEGLTPIGKTVANIETTITNRNSWQRITWDLETEVEETLLGKYPIIMTVEVRYAILNGEVAGYEYRNPIFALKREGQNFRIRGLAIRLNDEKINSVTIYNSLNRVASSVEAINFAENWAAALAYYPEASALDQHILEISSIELTSDVDTGEGAGGGGFRIPNTVTYTQLTSADPDLGVFTNYCMTCHNNSRQAGGINLQDYANASANAVLISDAVYGRNGAATMPPGASGITNIDRQVIQTWVDSGSTE